MPCEHCDIEHYCPVCSPKTPAPKPCFDCQEDQWHALLCHECSEAELLDGVEVAATPRDPAVAVVLSERQEP